MTYTQQVRRQQASSTISRLLAQDTSELDKAALNVFVASLLAGMTPAIPTNQPIKPEWLQNMPKGWLEQANQRVEDLYYATVGAIEDSLTPDYSEELGDDGRQTVNYTNSSWEDLVDEKAWLNELNIAIDQAINNK